jgi:hypothetical protein
MFKVSFLSNFTGAREIPGGTQDDKKNLKNLKPTAENKARKS